MRKLTVKDVLGIEAGKTAAFACTSSEMLNSQRTICYYLNKSKRKPYDVERYSSRYDREERMFYVTAVKYGADTSEK